MTNKEFERRLITIERMLVKLIDDIQQSEDGKQNSRITAIVNEVLSEIGLNEKMKGYNYLKEEIIIQIEKPNTKLYGYVSEKYSKKVTHVEYYVKSLKLKIFSKNRKEKLKKIFGDNEIPSNKEFIICLAEYVRRMDEQEQKTRKFFKEPKEEKKVTKSLVKEILRDVGIAPCYKGYKYLIEEIINKIEYPDGKLYCNSAQKYTISKSCIVSCIRIVKEKTFKKEEKSELFQKLFGEYSKIPSNKEFIVILVDYIEESSTM